MLISGGNDAKLFTYSAKAFLSFHPHDVCPCPERPFIQLANQFTPRGGTLMMTQHSTKVDIWMIHKNNFVAANGGNGKNGNSMLGKRKWEGDSDDDSSDVKPISNGHSNGDTGSKALVVRSNGYVPAQNGQKKLSVSRVEYKSGTSPG